MDAKTKSRDYFNTYRKSKLAHGGYWRHDYKYAFSVIKRISPDRLIDIGCGPGAFLEEVQRLFPDIQLNALDLSEEIPYLKAGDVRMYNRDEIMDFVSKAGFRKIKYRKISPFSFQFVAKK